MPSPQSPRRPRVRQHPDDRLDLVFGALADRTRRAMLRRLARGPSTVTELANPFDISLPAISRHLKVLGHAGLIDRSIDGRIHRCTLDPKALRAVDMWLEHYRAFWDETVDELTIFVGG